MHLDAQHLDSTTPLVDLFTESYRPMKLRGCSPHTPACHLAAIHGLETYWRSLDRQRSRRQLRVGDVTETLIAKYLDWLLTARRRKRATHNKHLRHLKAVWNWGRDEGLWEKGLRLDPLKDDERDPDCWSQEEFSRLLFAAAEQKGYVGDCPACYWWPGLILIVYSTGVRIDAVMHLLGADLDLEQRVVRVRAETQKDRAEQRFTLLPEVCAVLARMRPERLLHVFDDWPYDRTPYATAHHTWTALREQYRRILAQAKLPVSSRDLFHKLRRTFATEVALAADIRVAQALLGHSHESVTRRYVDRSKLPGPSAADLIRPPALPIQLRLFKPDEPPPTAKAS